jgi:hypothetical protein
MGFLPCLVGHVRRFADFCRNTLQNSVVKHVQIPTRTLLCRECMTYLQSIHSRNFSVDSRCRRRLYYPDLIRPHFPDGTWDRPVHVESWWDMGQETALQSTVGHETCLQSLVGHEKCLQSLVGHETCLQSLGGT